MVSSINNSTGVASALKALQDARADQSQSESRISSGYKVASSKDGPAAYAVAETLRSEANALRAVTDSLSRAQALSDVSTSSAEQVASILTELKAITTSALSPDLTDAQRGSYDEEFRQQLTALESVVRGASFDGSNLLDGSLPNGLSFVAEATATESLNLAGRNLLPDGAIVTLGFSNSLSTLAGAEAAHTALLQSLDNLGEELISIGAENKSVSAQIGFVARFADALAGGVGKLVDADLAEESALIQALQVKQSLSAEALNIANSAPQALLTLFR